ncbi:MAG: hypothetical protein KAR38_14060, partial [Calditrichia bacterium]|nr:hypothetical protein [Calditrichia bacterium]
MSNSKILTGIILLLLLDFIALNAQELKEVKYKNQKFPEKLLVKISVNLNEVPFEKALEIIAEKGNIKLNYNRNRIPVNKKVSVKMKNKETFKVLMKVLNITGTCLKVTPQGQLAIIPFKKGKSEIKGKIISKNSREPLIGANVLVTGTTIGS